MIGYCTNVHAGPDLRQTRQNLETHSLQVKREFSPDAPMGVGLWLAAPAASQLRGDMASREEFRQWLQEVGLIPFTFNGFPFGDFHQTVVKKAVYEPTWADPRRLSYTEDLVAVLDALLPPDRAGSISTLPIAWRAAVSDELLEAAGRHLAKAATSLARLHAEKGRHITLCVEPEPGCCLDRAGDVVRFLEQHVWPRDADGASRQHLGVCHDICHSAVMFEGQEDALDIYRRAGVRVGKVQVSAAVALPLEGEAEAMRAGGVDQLSEFSEPRYLHQSSWRHAEGLEFYEDLPDALSALRRDADRRGEVRVHFHVPIYLEQFGRLRTTQSQILECIAALDEDVTHFEVETYAWNVLPDSLRQPTLATGISRELAWFRDQLSASDSAAMV